jgi:hypothetical protein
VGKPEGKRPLGRRRRRWMDNIKIDLKRDKMGWYGLVRSGSGQEPVVLNLRVPINAGKFLSGCAIGSFSGRAQLRK